MKRLKIKSAQHTALPFSSQPHQYLGMVVSHQQCHHLHKYAFLYTSHRYVEDASVVDFGTLTIRLSLLDYSRKMIKKQYLCVDMDRDISIYFKLAKKLHK